MKGNNELILNESSMIVAVQEYIDKRITIETPKVTGIKISDKLCSLFSIKLEEQAHGQNDSKP